MATHYVPATRPVAATVGWSSTPPTTVAMSMAPAPAVIVTDEQRRADLLAPSSLRMDWSGRFALNTLILAGLVVQVLLIGAKTSGHLARTHWAVVFVPFWVVDALLAIYLAYWLFVHERNDAGADVYATRRDDALMHLPDHGATPLYSAELGSDATSPVFYSRDDADTLLGVASYASVNRTASYALFVLFYVAFVPLVVAFEVLLVVHLEGGRVSVMQALAPLIALVGLLFIVYVTRTLWRNGYAPLGIVCGGGG